MNHRGHIKSGSSSAKKHGWLLGHRVDSACIGCKCKSLSWSQESDIHWIHFCREGIPDVHVLNVAIGDTPDVDEANSILMKCTDQIDHACKMIQVSVSANWPAPLLSTIIIMLS